LDTHHQIVVEKLARALSVRADSPDDGGQVNYDIWTHVGIHLLDSFTEAKVVISARWDQYVVHSSFLQFLNHKRSEEASTASHHNSSLAPEVRHDHLLHVITAHKPFIMPGRSQALLGLPSEGLRRGGYPR
jgi:hypothetical protein